MRAAIDIGSNSIRLAMTDGTKRSIITKLADGIAASGVLSPVGVENTIAALKDFVKIAGGAEMFAFATEAVRRASDGEEFISRVKSETGITVKLLAPEEEARLALFGAKKPSGAVSVCDLGGGSMELISSENGVDPVYVKSLPLGVVVLKNMFETSADRPSAIRRAIDSADKLVQDYGETKPYPLVMLGGSACSIAAGLMSLNYYDGNKVNGYKITARDLDDFMPILSSPHIATLRPVLAKRADTVVYGAIIIRALLNKLGLTEFTVSDSDNLTAVLNGFKL